MDNNEQVNDSTTTETQEQELDLTLDGIEDADVLKAKIAEKDTFAKQAIARAKKAEAEIKELKAKATTKPQEVRTSNGADFEDALELRLQGYSKESVDFILRNGGVKSLETNPYVKAAVESIREQERAEKSLPNKDSGKSDIEKKFTDEQLRNMSTAELLKVLQKSNRQ